METDEKNSLEDLKKDYAEIQKRYSLPPFEELNKDFSIEGISEIKTDFLIREIRKFISEKLSIYFRFIESLLNPMNAPMFIFSIVKFLGLEDKEKLNGIYKKLSQLEIDILEIDLEFSEEKEAKFVKKAYKEWQEIKKDLLGIVGVFKNSVDKKSEANGKSYFG